MRKTLHNVVISCLPADKQIVATPKAESKLFRIEKDIDQLQSEIKNANKGRRQKPRK